MCRIRVRMRHMDKNLQIFGWAAISFFIGMGAQLTGAPNFLVGIAFYVFGGIGILFSTFNSLRIRFSISTCAISATIAGSAYFAIVWYAIVTSEKPPAPDVTARFVGRTQPNIILSNISDRTASNIKWSPVLFNMTEAYNAVTNGKDGVIQPLQIPSQSFDFLKAHQESLRSDLLQGRYLNMKIGDKIFGSITVNCPECGRGHTFLYYVVIGQSGWAWEDKKLENGNAWIPANGKASTILNYYNYFELSIPQDERSSIYER